MPEFEVICRVFIDFGSLQSDYPTTYLPRSCNFTSIRDLGWMSVMVCPRTCREPNPNSVHLYPCLADEANIHGSYCLTSTG